MIKAIIFDYNRTLFDPEIGIIPFTALRLLIALKSEGIKLGLISVNSKNSIDELFLSLFSFFLFTKEKTSEEFKLVLKKLGVNNTETLVVGDRIRSEIKVAKKLRIKTVWYRNGKFSNEFPQSSDEFPDYIVTDINDVRVIANNL